MKKIIAILAIAGAASLFAADINSVGALVEKINNTKNVEAKDKLLEDLKTELKEINPKDYQEARELVNKKLKISNKS